MFVHVACKGPVGFAHFYGDLIFSSVRSTKFHRIVCSERETDRQTDRHAAKCHLSHLPCESACNRANGVSERVRKKGRKTAVDCWPQDAAAAVLLSGGALVRRCSYPAVLLSGGALVRRCSCPAVLLSDGALVRRCSYPTMLLSGGAFVRRCSCPAVLLSDDALIRRCSCPDVLLSDGASQMDGQSPVDCEEWRHCGPQQSELTRWSRPLGRPSDTWPAGNDRTVVDPMQYDPSETYGFLASH